MLVSVKRQLKGAVLENLMTAHKRLSHCGNVFHLIILTRYILRLLKKQPDELVEIVTE